MQSLFFDWLKYNGLMIDFQQKMNKGPVNLASVHSSGKCLAVNDEKNVFLDNGIPGEEVMFISHRRKQGFRSGSVTRIISPSPFRISPFCIHHNDCGGCPWQHIEYNHQLRLKHEILTNALNKYDVPVPAIPEVLPSPRLHFYRHRVEYAFSVPELLGYHNSNNPGTVVRISECYLQPRISRAICDFIQTYAGHNRIEFYDSRNYAGFLRSLSIRTNKKGELLVVVGFHEDRKEMREQLLMKLKDKFSEIVSVNYTMHLSPSHSQMQGEIFSACGTQPWFYESAGEFQFRVHAGSFFQPNVLQAENIFNTIREWACLKGTEKVVDLYTGVGTIAQFLSASAAHVTGIEGSRLAIEDARASAEMNNAENLEFIQGDILETFTPEFIRKHGKPDVIVLDPPRSGTLIEIKKTINSSGAEKVIYLSCNPVSLAFDLKQLTEVYNISRIQPFDMLPHTHHLETLVMLERKG